MTVTLIPQTRMHIRGENNKKFLTLLHPSECKRVKGVRFRVELNVNGFTVKESSSAIFISLTSQWGSTVDERICLSGPVVQN